ncbi:hypothetical protein [Klebsiella pneumoniae]|uniref:hypothetical protein n=1 Tax=Klebsiella pneumoniae TaxID=573 RepID=UPI000807FC96|nr:hypothetical protein [Klebsiella pneumoniae]MBZ1999408.1 hypothetical protein [Klebsiella pneumoniae]MDD1879013.1 hypothetical protein [Klebsiella pneumoniae]MEC4502298.1 hypothetical protein [Klebsiella pneumoniae]UTB34355.1 hypothetical protein NKS82_13880 [Klebsiella pneumoniae]SBW39086.1 Uncharacterised protein [Klebsiella pneumoniae]
MFNKEVNAAKRAAKQLQMANAIASEQARRNAVLSNPDRFKRDEAELAAIHEAIYKEKAHAEAFAKRKYIGDLTSYVKKIPNGYKWSWQIRRELEEQLKGMVNGESRIVNLMALSATANFVWSTNNSSVATVVKTGTDTDTSSQAIVTAVKAGNVTITCTMTDVDGTTATGSLRITVTAAPADKAHAKSGVVSLSATTATVGTAFTCNASLSSPVEPDDGGYTYAWSFSGSYQGLSFGSSNKSTTTISGTPTAAGTCSVRCSVKDSYGNYATITAASITVSAGQEEGTVNSITLNAPTTYKAQNTSTEYIGPLVCTPDEPDDGTYSYTWYVNGNGTGLGNLYDVNKTALVSNQAYTGTKYQQVYFGNKHNAGTTGPIHWFCTVKDKHGNSVIYPKGATTGSGYANITVN